MTTLSGCFREPASPQHGPGGAVRMADDPLTSFLYELLRDGDISEDRLQVLLRNSLADGTYSNKELALRARLAADELRNRHRRVEVASHRVA